jgi:hypothetical protein
MSLYTDVETHAKLKAYTDLKPDADIKKVLEDFIAKGVEYDIYGDTWIDLDLDPETQAKLLKYAQGKHLPRSIIVAQFVAQGVLYDIADENWIKKLLKVKKIKDGYASTGDCDGLAYSVDEKGIPVYTCVWFREGRPPQIRILGHHEELQLARCAACKKTEEIAKDFEERDIRIHELETGLKTRARELYKIPVCEGGAHLIPDGTGFERCRRSNISVDISRFCKVVDDGPCAFFREVVVGVGEKT